MILATQITASSIWGLAGLVLGGLITYLTSRNKTSSDIEIAKINSSSSKFGEDVKQLRQELMEMTDSYHEIKNKYHKALEKDKINGSVIKDYENLLRHYRFIFKLAYEMVKPKLEGDSEAMILLEEVKDMFSEDFKLK